MSEWMIFVGTAFGFLFAGFLAGYSIAWGAGQAEGFRKGHAAASRYQGRKGNVG